MWRTGKAFCRTSHIPGLLAVSRLDQVLHFGGNTPAVRLWPSRSLTSWPWGGSLISDAESEPVVKVVY